MKSLDSCSSGSFVEWQSLSVALCSSSLSDAPDVLQLPNQILDPQERRNSIFIDRNNQYDLREAREVEQASLQLDALDQKKFGNAFVKFPKVQPVPLHRTYSLPVSQGNDTCADMGIGEGLHPARPFSTLRL